MEKYQSLLSFFSSFLTVAAVAGFTGVMAEQLAGGKKAGISGKLRYLCALAVVASLAAPLPGFLASLKSALSAPLDLTDRLSAYGDGDALGGALFSAAAEETLEKNFGDELRSRLSLTEKDLLLFFSVKEEPVPPASSSENAEGNAAGNTTGSAVDNAADNTAGFTVGSTGGAAGNTVGAENGEKAPAGEANTGDRLFSVEQVRAELYTLRAVAKTEEIRRALAVFSCPVEIRECLLDAHDGEETGEGETAGSQSRYHKP